MVWRNNAISLKKTSSSPNDKQKYLNMYLSKLSQTYFQFTREIYSRNIYIKSAKFVSILVSPNVGHQKESLYPK